LKHGSDCGAIGPYGKVIDRFLRIECRHLQLILCTLATTLLICICVVVVAIAAGKSLDRGSAVSYIIGFGAAVSVVLTFLTAVSYDVVVGSQPHNTEV